MTARTEAEVATDTSRLQAMLSSLGLQLLNYALILLLALGVGALAIAASGKDPVAAYQALLRGAFGGVRAVANTLDRSTVMILAGLSAVLAFSTRVRNLGIEGQLYMGAFIAAWVGFGIHGLPSLLHIVLAFVASAIAGAAWGLVPILLRTRWDVDEIVTSLMFNYIATFFTAYLVAFPFKSDTTILPGTDPINATAKLPRFIRGSPLSVGFPMALVLVFVVYWFLFRTKQGYELRMVGMNPRFAAYAGLPVKRSALLGMLLSGAMAGVGGASLILGFFGRFITQFSLGYGWDGIVISLLAKNNPIAVIPAAIFYAGLANGSLEMQSATQVPTMLVSTVKGVIMFIVTTQVFLRHLARRSQR
ncbi:MAG: ABC transporter permease [Anaerolineales bacterium]|nr:MAG: ABC transporter permease [Anaerolineales bacterium]